MSKVVPVEAGETADEKPPPLKAEASFITSDALSGLSPKVGPGGFLLVFLSVFAPSLLFCAVFSVMGYGHIVYDILVRLGSRTVPKSREPFSRHRGDDAGAENDGSDAMIPGVADKHEASVRRHGDTVGVMKRGLVRLSVLETGNGSRQRRRGSI